MTVTPNSEDELKAALMKGPVSVSICAESIYFQFYLKGIITTPKCGYDLDHGVLAVGYGTNRKGEDYFIIKNSWSKYWGNDGYVKLGAEKTGKGGCGVQMEPFLPIA